jgi:hypothetical protein
MNIFSFFREIFASLADPCPRSSTTNEHVAWQMRRIERRAQKRRAELEERKDLFERDPVTRMRKIFYEQLKDHGFEGESMFSNQFAPDGQLFEDYYTWKLT